MFVGLVDRDLTVPLHDECREAAVSARALDAARGCRPADVPLRVRECRTLRRARDRSLLGYSVTIEEDRNLSEEGKANPVLVLLDEDGVAPVLERVPVRA